MPPSKLGICSGGTVSLMATEAKVRGAWSTNEPKKGQGREGRKRGVFGARFGQV